MLDQDGVTVVYLFSFQKYLQYFHIGCKFPHYSADCTTGVWTGHQKKTKDFVTWHGQAVTKHPWWLAASSQPLFFCWQSLLPKTTVGPLSLKMLKTQLDMTWTTSRNVILALLWGGSWTAWLLEVPCNLTIPNFSAYRTLDHFGVPHTVEGEMQYQSLTEKFINPKHSCLPRYDEGKKKPQKVMALGQAWEIMAWFIFWNLSPVHPRSYHE